ncbi:MAG: hypothetical protein WC866_00545 [Patescibacteria group bacterium]|jgi:hypothetical protein
MPTKDELAAIEAHMYKMAAGLEEGSALWMYLNFLDDLAKGFLAYRPLKGCIESLVEILEHDALVVVTHENGGTLATYIHGEDKEFEEVSAAMQSYLMQTLPGSNEFPTEALSKLPYTGREVVAAITMSRAQSEQPTVILFYLPLFEDATIYAAIKGAIVVDA